MKKEEDFFIEQKVSAAQQAKQLIRNTVRDPFGHLLGLAFYIVSAACGIWCVLIAINLAASILGVF
jgi:hypothetical protein